MRYVKQYEFKLCLLFKLSPNGRGMIFGPNGKDIMAPMECTPMVYNCNGKGMVL